MRVWQTFGIGAALAVLPLVLGLSYAVDRLQALASQNERLMLRQLAAVRLGTGVAARLDRLGEYQRKYSALHDEAYAEKAKETSLAIDGELTTLRASVLGIDEAPFAAFSARWRDYRERGVEDEQAALTVDELVSAVDDLLARASAAAAADAHDAVVTRESTARAAVLATLVAVCSSTAVIVVLVRRLRRRLDDLVAATEAVSRGAFSTYVDAADGDELGRVAGAFNRMVEGLDQLERLKAELLSSVSHELKTPLVAMVETNNALLDEIAGALSPQQRRMIELNRAAAQRLSTMIAELLELSVVRSIGYNIESGDIARLVKDAVSELEARARERGLRVDVHCEGPLVARRDPDRFVQIIQNLVDNAIKYTPRDGAIEVRLTRASPADLADIAAVVGAAAGGPWALLCVDDTGPGIAPVDRERVFEKFFRGQGLAADGGVGLGLAICRELVTAQRGFIWARDGRLGGAGITVAWPLEEAA